MRDFVAVRERRAPLAAAPEVAEEEEEGVAEEASPARAARARPRRAAGGRATRDAREARDDSENAATRRPVAERESRPHASVADTPRSRRARGASAIVRAATRDRSSRAEPRATHGAIARDATGTEVIFFVPSGPGRGSPRASGEHTRRACWYDTRVGPYLVRSVVVSTRPGSPTLMRECHRPSDNARHVLLGACGKINALSSTFVDY